MQGQTTISNEEYKELILKEKKLEEIERQLTYVNEILNCKEVKISKLEKELKDLILVVTGGKERASYKEYEFSGYDIGERDDIAYYINKNYMSNGVVKFRKVEKKEEEVNE